MNILIIGLGSIAKKHINAIMQINPKAKIYALRSTNHSINEYKNVINVYSLFEIKVELNFVLISNPTSLHENAILNCISLKIPIFIEKPVLSNLKNAQFIQNQINKNNIITYVACNMRFNPAIEFIKSSLLNQIKKINEVNIYCGSYLPTWRPESNYRTSYSSDRNLGGGVDLDMIHEIDYAVWLFGYPEKIQSIKSSKSSLNINSNDYAHFALEYNDFIANITLNYFRLDTKREVEILTNEDTYIVNLQNSTIFSKLKNTYIFNCQYNILDTYLKQMEYFFQHINSRKKTMNDFGDGVKILNIALNEEIKK